MNKDRRKFLKDSTIVISGGVAFSLLSSFQSCNTIANDKKQVSSNKYQTTNIKQQTSNIVIAKNERAIDEQNRINASAVNEMIKKAIIKFTNLDSAKDGWASLFSPSDIVGIKVNCIAGKMLSTHLEVVLAVVDGLKSAGIPQSNIIIWDKSDSDLKNCGYPINTGGTEVKCYGTNKVGYDFDVTIQGAIGSCLSKILHQCSALINIPILKDHELAGVSISMKNYYGIINNPNKYHDNNCSPYCADVYSIPEVANKTKLIICDAIVAQYNGGPSFKPQWMWKPSQIIVGTDPVAIDYTGWQIIEEKRKEKGIPSLKQSNREPTYIAVAGDNEHKLGTNDPNKIKIIEC